MSQVIDRAMEKLRDVSGMGRMFTPGERAAILNRIDAAEEHGIGDYEIGGYNSAICETCGHWLVKTARHKDGSWDLRLQCDTLDCKEYHENGIEIKKPSGNLWLSLEGSRFYEQGKR